MSGTQKGLAVIASKLKEYGYPNSDGPLLLGGYYRYSTATTPLLLLLQLLQSAECTHQLFMIPTHEGALSS